MIRQIRSTPAREKHSQGKRVIPETFDDTPLSPDIAQQVRTTAQRIRQMVERTREDLLMVGRDLLAVKAALPHGRFGPWLRAEFGWTERTARPITTSPDPFPFFEAVVQRGGFVLDDHGQRDAGSHGVPFFTLPAVHQVRSHRVAHECDCPRHHT